MNGLELNLKEDIIHTVPIAGAAGVDVAQILGLTINEWFYVSAIAYTLVHCWVLTYKTIKQNKHYSKGDDSP